jgi:hypothetical protein
MDVIDTTLRQPPERVTRSASLGLRFVDVATTREVAGGLVVRAARLNARDRAVEAVPNPSGILVFARLPGQVGYELGDPEARQDDGSPKASVVRSYELRVADREGRYLPFRLVVTAPRLGLFGLDFESLPALLAWLPAGIRARRPLVPLYAAPGRTVPAGMAVVRMDLTTGGEKVPASWALVQVLLANGGAAPTVVAEGIADARGCALVLFPYPEPRDLLPASRVLIGTEFTRHSWDVQCQVFHSGIDAGTEPPDLMAILAQRSGQPALIADGTAAGSRVMSGRLEQGRELILRSPASRFSKLIIHPADSPP